jgi:hypothetical protein
VLLDLSVSLGRLMTLALLKGSVPIRRGSSIVWHELTPEPVFRGADESKSWRGDTRVGKGHAEMEVLHLPTFSGGVAAHVTRIAAFRRGKSAA